MKIGLFVVAALLAGFGDSFAQADSALAFFPLHTGNLWQYHFHYGGSCGSTHSSYHVQEVVGDTVLSTGHEYKIVWSDVPLEEPVRYVRVDTATANVYQYAEFPSPGEFLVDSLRSTVGSGFVNGISGIYTECDAVYDTTVLGELSVVKHFWMWVIHPIDYMLGSGFGRTQRIDRWDSGCLPTLDLVYKDLVFARIDGIEYGTYVSVDAVEVHVPLKPSLEQNYPNPFNPSTTIDYSLPRKVQVRLEVFNVLGERVNVLREGIQEAGHHSVVFDAKTLPSGIYFYRLQAGGFVETKKLILTR
jgi:hypothetical protein